MLNREQAANVEVLAGLGLDGLVGSNDQQHKVDAANPRQHVADKALMPGHIDESEAEFLAIWRIQFQMREADVDRDAATLFLFKSVGINTRKRLD